MTDILVTGATGILGRQLIQSLQERGDALRALVLPGENAGWLEERGVAICRGDVREPDTVVQPMRGVDKVFHLAGMMGVWCPMSNYYSVNVTGTNVFGTKNRHAIGEARAELGYAPRVSLAEGVRLAANWYLQQHTPGAISVSEAARPEHV